MTKTAANPVSLGITNMAVLPVVGGNYVASIETGHVFVMRSPEVFSNDANGNLLSDGRWNFTWDADNWLVKMESRPDTPSSSWRRIEWTYDAFGRRIQQVTSIWTNNAWFVVENLKLVSDPMLFGRHIVELNATNNALVRTYVWGLDLSGTIAGAGGVGGLAWVTLHTASGPASGTQFVCYDGNGNIVALVNAATGDVTARYEYGPFGEPIRVSGPVAAMNPFRFSTKRTNPTTDLVLYEYRAYNPNFGRWLSRDPIGELGGENLYRSVRNSPSDYTDLGGLFEIPGTGVHLTGCYNYEVNYVTHTAIVLEKPYFAPQQKILDEIARQVKSKFPLRGKGGDCFGSCKTLIDIDANFTTPPVTQTKKILFWDVTVKVTVTIHVKANVKVCCGIR